MPSNLIDIPECVNYVNAAVESGAVKFCFLSDAPFLVKLLRNGGYCAYKNTVYVPLGHFNLASSSNESDRTIATAKILPWVMTIKYNQVPSLWKTWCVLSNYETLAKYFYYEYGFLKVSNHPFAEIILAGFLNSRKTRLGRKVPPETVIDCMKQIMQTA